MSNAIGAVAPKFDSYEQYAQSRLNEVVPQSFLDGALQLEVTELRSGVLLNDGAGHFVFSPFGHLAQGSAAFGVGVLDCNADGHLDIVLAQNSFSPQRETGRIDGGLGLVLLGNGTGLFEPATPAQSGLVIPGDAKSLLCADLNQDGALDILIGVNHGNTHVLMSTAPGSGITLRLEGLAGNPSAVGAFLVGVYEDGSEMVQEVYAGGSYLAQGTPACVFPIGEYGIVAFKVRWPRGNETLHEVKPNQRGSLSINQSE